MGLAGDAALSTVAVAGNAPIVGEKSLAATDPAAGGGGKGPGNRKPKPAPRVQNLDGVRGLGILLVMAYHLRLGVPNAWVAIGLFFSLSGLLMTNIALGVFAKKGAFGAVFFWNRRVLRLLPAILMLVAVIALVTVAQRAGLVGTPPTSEEQWFLYTDLMWALAYGENFNLIWRDNNYFADFQRASVMRHVWSLAVEEQYYIVWPGIFIALSTMASSMQPKGALAPPAVDTDPHSVSPRVRTMVKFLVCFELLAIGFSQWIGKYTYEAQGPSPAYYLSWTRAGDFAVGGLVACTVFLLPQETFARYTRAPDLPKMSFRYRVLLECGSAGVVLGMILGPMIPTPKEQLLDHYFGWFRIPYALFVLFNTIPQTLQTSEPLPRWAIFTRWMCNPTIVFLGVTSYGLYLVHWVLIVWFGDSALNTAHSETTLHGRQEGYGPLARDVAIAIASVVISTASYFMFEVPVMKLGSKHPPCRVIATGLASTVAVGVLVLAATSGREDPRQDQTARFFAENLPVEVPTMLFLGDSQANKIADIYARNIQDPEWGTAEPRCSGANRSLWGPRVVSGGNMGQGLIQYFAPVKKCPRCHTATYNPYFAKKNLWGMYSQATHLAPKIMDTIDTHPAKYLFVIEARWFTPWPMQVWTKKMTKKVLHANIGLHHMEPLLLDALKTMLDHLRNNGAQHVFLSTSTPYPTTLLPGGEGGSMADFAIDDARSTHVPEVQRSRFLEVMEKLRCRDTSDPTDERLFVTLVDYHKLVCPDYDRFPTVLPNEKGAVDPGSQTHRASKQQCSHHQHGFNDQDFMPDDVHPPPNAIGHWLVSQLGEIIRMAVEASEGIAAARAFAAPYSCLHARYPLDEAQDLTALFQTVEVCFPRLA